VLKPSRSDNTAPIGLEESATFFAPLQPYSKVVLAVSGGADSLALLVLAAKWRASAPTTTPELSVATVDHALRAGSTEEAAYVHDVANSFGIPHTTLTWSGEKPATRLQERARAARYDLLITHARTIGAGAIVTAHHAQDQAETVLMRLCAGSGISGLAAMPLVTLNTGMPLIRPFLSLDKDRLIATLKADGLRWLEDPSNQSTRFERVRLRSAFAALAEEGLDTHRLRKLAARAKRADIALAHATETAFAHHHIPDKQNRLRFAPGLFREPEEIILRIILRALNRMTPEKETPLEKAENLLARLVAGRSLRQSVRMTLSGHVIDLKTNGILVFSLENDPRRR
jgi:tRNA(Ile)-lysidine synthase